MNVNIRRVKQEDAEELYRVECAGFPPEEGASRDSIEKRIAAFPDSFYVAELCGEDGSPQKLIGLINGCVSDQAVICDEMFEDETLHRPEGAYQMIFGLAVDPDFRRRGVAEQLMNRLIQESKAAERQGMVLTCKEHLIHYYEKFGFCSQGISASNHGGAQWYDMLYLF